MEKKKKERKKKNIAIHGINTCICPSVHGDPTIRRTSAMSEVIRQESRWQPPRTKSRFLGGESYQTRRGGAVDLVPASRSKLGHRAEAFPSTRSLVESFLGEKEIDEPTRIRAFRGNARLEGSTRGTWWNGTTLRRVRAEPLPARKRKKE